MILTPHSTRNWFRSHTQKVVSYMHLYKFQISLNGPIYQIYKSDTVPIV